LTTARIDVKGLERGLVEQHLTAI